MPALPCRHPSPRPARRMALWALLPLLALTGCVKVAYLGGSAKTVKLYLRPSVQCTQTSYDLAGCSLKSGLTGTTWTVRTVTLQDGAGTTKSWASSSAVITGPLATQCPSRGRCGPLAAVELALPWGADPLCARAGSTLRATVRYEWWLNGTSQGTFDEVMTNDRWLDVPMPGMVKVPSC